MHVNTEYDIRINFLYEFYNLPVTKSGSSNDEYYCPRLQHTIIRLEKNTFVSHCCRIISEGIFFASWWEAENKTLKESEILGKISGKKERLSDLPNSKQRNDEKQIIFLLGLTQQKGTMMSNKVCRLQ